MMPLLPGTFKAYMNFRYQDKLYLRYIRLCCKPADFPARSVSPRILYLIAGRYLHHCDYHRLVQLAVDIRCLSELDREVVWAVFQNPMLSARGIK